MHGQSRLLRRGIQIERPVAIGKKRLEHALVPRWATPLVRGCPVFMGLARTQGHRPKSTMAQAYARASV
jgi:hypothetical protein